MSKVDIGALDVCFYLISRFTNEKVPWRGGREKDSKLMQILIEALTTHGFVVLDAYASTSWIFFIFLYSSCNAFFYYGFVCGLCDFFAFQTFQWHVDLFMLAEVVTAI
jgi:hypothetical protein